MLDEPRRGGGAHRAGLPGHRHHRGLRLRRCGERGEEAVRRTVPPGGAAHGIRHAGAGKLPVPHLRLQRRVDHGVLSGRGRGGMPPPDRQRPGAAGAVRRRGQLCGGGAAAARRRRPADVHLRGSRPAAQGRGRSGGAGDEAPVPRGCAACERRRPVPEQAGRRDRAGAQAQDHRRGVYPRL